MRGSVQSTHSSRSRLTHSETPASARKFLGSKSETSISVGENVEKTAQLEEKDLSDELQVKLSIDNTG